MNRSVLALVLAFLLAGAPGALAQTPPPPPGPPVPPQQGPLQPPPPPPPLPPSGPSDDTDSSKVVLPTATSVSASSAAIRKSGGGLMLLGSPFHGGPTEMSVMTPKRLTIWLPKSIKVSSAPAKPCTKAFARTMNINQQHLWLRGRGDTDDESALVGFGTGWIELVKGGTKLTLELGALGIDTRGLEVYSGVEPTTAGKVHPLSGKCTGKFRMRLDTAQGSATKSFRC
jgi:hypothetical protein